MKKARVVLAGLVTVAGVLLATDQDSYPHWVRGGVVGVLVLGAALGIPAAPAITIAAAKRDLPAAASVIEQARNDAANG